MQVLEEELQLCQDDRRADLERIRSLNEENEELRKRLHLRHTDDTLTDIETTGTLSPQQRVLQYYRVEYVSSTHALVA